MTTRQYTILIIDDCGEDREMYCRYLSREAVFNYRFVKAESGEQALEYLATIQVDLILLDYLLPDIDGLEFIEEFKKVKASEIPPMIMLTGEGNEKIAIEAMKSGFKDYLVKGSVTAEVLVTAIKNALQQDYLQSLLTNNIRQQQLIAETALRIRQSLDLNKILNTAVREVRILLNCDRVIIYRFAPDMSGEVVAESLKLGWKKSLGTKVTDTCFQNQGASKYQRGETWAFSNIYDSQLSECHIKLLEEFQVKANAVVPILLTPSSLPSDDPTLWGLLITHQCNNTRQWETDEIELLDKLVVQLAIAIKQAELLGNLRQELDNFAYVTSHDLKAPLRAIANLAAWLSEDLEGQIPEENQRQLQLMQSRVKRMDGLIQGLLEYSRVGRKKTPIKTINVSDVIKEAINSLSVPPEFEIVVAPNMPTLITEVLSLQQVFSNLISNAIKYHPTNLGKITISIEEQAHFYEFGVSDDGLGIDPQYHDRIFTIFQTLQPRDTIESTGIGLSIVKKIVEGQGGKVRVESKLGEGASFFQLSLIKT
jgi:light-regulated signal transduction histidine kinase (bacteriophytochrome)